MRDFGMLIRDAMPEDARGVAEVHVRAWQIAYYGLMPQAFLDRLSVEERAKRYTFGDCGKEKPQTLLAVEADEILGFATVGAGRDENLAGYGELYALYVDPLHWGKKVGLKLMVAARERLCEHGCTQAFLWLLRGNERAERFYLRDGWSADNSERIDTSHGIVIKEVRMLRRL